MKWDCDKWWQRKQQWHYWFAWYPIKLGLNDCRWLEYVARKGEYTSDWDGGYWTYEYKECID